MTAVKLCGITRLGDARRAAELGAWAIGLNFWPESPRRVDLGAAEQIGAELKRELEVAGVFVNATLDEVAQAADRCSLTLLQLHGDEGPAFCSEAARRTGCKVMKVARVRDAGHVAGLRAFHTDFHMLDAYVPDVPGGTGRRFEWELARGHDGSVPLVLSGGLTPENVGEAIATVQPFAVDTATGTEASPGVKDPAKVEAFFRAVESTREGAPA